MSGSARSRSQPAQRREGALQRSRFCWSRKTGARGTEWILCGLHVRRGSSPPPPSRKLRDPPDFVARAPVICTRLVRLLLASFLVSWRKTPGPFRSFDLDLRVERCTHLGNVTRKAGPESTVVGEIFPETHIPHSSTTPLCQANLEGVP